MTLPTKEQMTTLSGLIVDHGKTIGHKWYTFKGVLQALKRSSGDIASHAVSSGAQSAVTHGAGIASGLVIAPGVAFAPLGAAISPWIAAAEVVRRSGDIWNLHDLHTHAVDGATGSTVHYSCMCGKCAGNIKYVINKKERNVGRIAIGVGTLGVSALFTTAWSIGKKVYSKAKGEMRPKERVSRELIESARSGCTVALATVFLLAGNWEWMRGGNAATMQRAIAMIIAEDGWSELKSSW